MAKSVVRSQMGGEKAPSPEGVSTAVKQYKCPPFSEHPHDVGTGGIPTTVEVNMGAKMPKTQAPAFSSPNGQTGAPSQGTRRYSK